ncbi:uncharacterized protein A4U43_C05F14130 [Asparagus officinalis]|uniref:Uncharacterized protein n=1 Tax=Asparagus officinalis TaxID=4686 RepID=A0A5P1EV83_ASPOF|nr:uncharacterized protein A4U43_C05F14130 [Asparagus officinalis]
MLLERLVQYEPVMWIWGPISRGELGDGVFVRGVARFIVGDDLRVVKASAAATISLFQKFDIKSVGALERKEVNFGREELPKPWTEVGGSFVKRFSSFTVTDVMVVTHLSPVSNVEIFKEPKAPIETLLEKKVTLGETEVKMLYV